MRSDYGLTKFEGFEGSYSDFTVKHSSISRHITGWLIAGGFSIAEKWKHEHVAYHLEVKSTVGTCDEPFIMSPNQVDLVSSFSWVSLPRVYADQLYVGPKMAQ